MENIWIIGLGHFGQRAVRELSKNQNNRYFVMVDPNQENLDKARYKNCTLEQADGVDFLNQHLYPGNEPDWIIPALPVHLAAEWCLQRLKNQLCRILLPPSIETLLPNLMRGDTGDIYVSHATFLCPENCSEPRNICTVTQKPRKQNMFEFLENIRLPLFQPLVIRSYQLGEGIGGYRPEQLFNLLRQVEKAKDNVLVSTACRCHGVVTGCSRFY